MDIKKDKFNEKLLVVLDKSMKNIFGENTVNAVYYHLQKRYLIKLEDIPEKPQVFAEAIKEIFGATGADVIETFIVRDLCDKFRIGGQRKEISKLVDFLDEVKGMASRDG